MSGRRTSRSLVAPVLSVLVAGLLAAVPVAASAAEEGDDYVEARSKANANTADGSSSAFGEAFEKAAREDEPVEVTSERRVDAQVFANPDGTITQEVSQTPIFAKDDGELKPLAPNPTQSQAE